MPSPTFQPEQFINRELSWLEFNGRVLEEAVNSENLLLERVKFLAIFASNLDEFFMVRVAGLREQAFGVIRAQDSPADGLSPLEQLAAISAHARQLVAEQYACWNDSIVPMLESHGISFCTKSDLNGKQVRSLDKFFRQRIFPVLTPMAIDPSHPSPIFHNRAIYLGAQLKRRGGIGPKQLFSVVQLPQVLPRLIPIEPGDTHSYILLEDLVADRLPELFGGYDIVDHSTFRVTRDMDIDLLEQESDDMLHAIESRLRERRQTEAVRLEVSDEMDHEMLQMITSEEGIRQPEAMDIGGYDEVYSINGMLDMSSLFELASLRGRSDLRDPSFTPAFPPGLHSREGIFDVIDRNDLLLHHPFDSFDPVVDFIEQSAIDPQVLAIKQTLYRTSGDSPIVRALIDAAGNGKQVTALVELKARFDEANNIVWARQMERAGVHVVYGFMDLKTHCKLSLVVRQDGKRVRRYAHLSTGNYNPTTAKLYTDLGLFTSNQEFAEDASALFNFLTGYSQNYNWNKLVVAPQDLHTKTIQLINEQTELAQRGLPARIYAKLNSLVDRATIEALYRASQAGVPIDLVIRGICCLRPGLPDVSENIHVRSIVDRFLEHSRVMVFGEGEDRKVFLSSADWMPRNFNRRVEVMFPIEDPALIERIVDEIAPIYLRDNCRARILQSNGNYAAARRTKGEPAVRAQVELLRYPTGDAAHGSLDVVPFPTTSGKHKGNKSGRNKSERQGRQSKEKRRS